MLAPTLERTRLTQLEQIEISYWGKYYNDQQTLPSYASVIAGAWVGSVPSQNILALNRVIGLGVREPISTARLEDIISFYAKTGAKRFFLQIAPDVLSDTTEESLKATGFSYYNDWAKLCLKTSWSVITPNHKLRIQKIGPAEALEFATILFQCFDWEDPALIAWLAAPVGTEGYSHYFVYYLDRPIAVGALYCENDMGSMAFAATLPEFRGLGAQTLLLQTRLKEAHAKGVKYLTSETGHPRPNKPVQSFTNMLRQGFQVAYLRQNWIYEF